MRKSILLAALSALLLLGVQPGFAGWDEGVAAFKAGNYSGAAREFETLVQQRPDCAACYMMLGQSLLKLNRSQEAVTQLRKAYDMNPSDTSVRLPLAQAYLQAKRYDDALQLLKTLDPSTLDKAKQRAYYQMRATALDKSGRRDELLGDLRRMAQSNPQDATAQFNYGRSALAARETDAAIPALEAAARLDPKSTDKKQTLVKAYMLKGRQSQGSAKLQVYQKAAAVGQQLVAASGSYDNLMLLGEAQLGAKQYDAAITSFDRAKNANGNDWLALYYLAQAQTARQHYGPAEANLKTALNKTKDTREQTMIWKQLGFVYEKQRKLDEAKMAYRKVGDQASLERIERNEEILAENADIEAYNEEVRRLEEEKKALEEQMQDLPPNF
ncbi:MAG TPA: tetratricopeptide repeat protein [Thermoanaerobaculia bacterium]|nr:tetratricopeptide repeat protein [Thermoanaerobaculia bacterium]